MCVYRWPLWLANTTKVYGGMLVGAHYSQQGGPGRSVCLNGGAARVEFRFDPYGLRGS